MTTKDQKHYQQKFYQIDGQLKAMADIYLTHEQRSCPSIADCRFAALQLKNKGNGYVVYDRLLCRIVDGVYYGTNALDNALGVAQLYNEGYGNPDMSPNGVALGLKYPKGNRDKNQKIIIEELEDTFEHGEGATQ